LNSCLTSLHSGKPLVSVPSQVLADLEDSSPTDNRDQNVSRNTELLLATDIHKLPTAPSPASTTPKKPAQPKKTKVNRPSTSLPPDKQHEERDKAGLRSSTRVRGQNLDAKQKEEEAKKLVELRDEEDEEEGSYYENGKRIKTESGYGALIRSLIHSESCVILRFTSNADVSSRATLQQLLRSSASDCTIQRDSDTSQAFKLERSSRSEWRHPRSVSFRIVFDSLKAD